MTSFKVGRYKVSIGKTAGYIILAFIIGWLCGCTEYDETGQAYSGTEQFKKICIDGTQHYVRVYGRQGFMSPVIIKGDFVSCNK